MDNNFKINASINNYIDEINETKKTYINYLIGE